MQERFDRGQDERILHGPRILVCDSVDRKIIDGFIERGYEVDVRIGLTPDELRDKLPQYQVAIVRSATIITGDMLRDNRGDLDIIARAGVGIDNIDIPAAIEEGILVINTPTASSISVAELTMATAINLSRKIPFVQEQLIEGKAVKVNGREVRGKTLAIIGLGNIGKEVAARAKAFGMDVIAFDPYVNPEDAEKAGVALISNKKELLRLADILTIHISGDSQVICAEELALMQEHAIIINNARSGVLDEEALIIALEEGRLAGAGMDVFANEPLPDPRLLDLARKGKVVITPHVGASTVESQGRIGEDVVQQVDDALKKGIVRGGVNYPRISVETMERLKPHTELARGIATLLGAIAPEEQVDRIEVNYTEELTREGDVTLLTAAVVQGILSPDDQRRINPVNYKFVTNEQGIAITEGNYVPSYAGTSGIEVRLVLGDKIVQIEGILGSRGAEIVEINGLRVNLPVQEGNFLLCENTNTPGRIADVTAILHTLGINVEWLSVAPSRNQERAMMGFILAQSLTVEQLAAIQKVEGVEPHFVNLKFLDPLTKIRGFGNINRAADEDA